MPKTATVTVKIDDAKLKERMAEFLAQAWDEGFSHRDEMTARSCDGVDDCNPYRTNE